MATAAATRTTRTTSSRTRRSALSSVVLPLGSATGTDTEAELGSGSGSGTDGAVRKPRRAKLRAENGTRRGGGELESRQRRKPGRPPKKKSAIFLQTTGGRGESLKSAPRRRPGRPRKGEPTRHVDASRRKRRSDGEADADFLTTEDEHAARQEKVPFGIIPRLKKKARLVVELESDGRSPSTRKYIQESRQVETNVGHGLENHDVEMLDVIELPDRGKPKHIITEELKIITVHQDKVAQGLQHEVNLQQASPENKKSQAARRTLRSQEGSRFKSELALYFPEYDEIIGNEPRQTHLLDLETHIVLIDSDDAVGDLQDQDRNVARVRDIPSTLFYNLSNAQRVDLPTLEALPELDESDDDHMTYEYFQSIHRRPERAERAIRNGDKGRAQHEKDQVIRLLGGLQGSDWLKIMGVSGITEGRKKDFEPARAYFIRGCQSVLDKFRIWKDEEKRRKAEKELAAIEDEEEEDSEDEQEEDEEFADDSRHTDTSEGDAAARQLREEAKARNIAHSRTKNTHRKSKLDSVPEAPSPPKPFRSFFRKAHEREAALRPNRRNTRVNIAWGEPLPALEDDVDFVLPGNFFDGDFMKARSRAKRRDRRAAKG